MTTRMQRPTVLRSGGNTGDPPLGAPDWTTDQRDIEQLAYERGKEDTLNYFTAMRIDYRTIPHKEFYEKWPDWRDYEEMLPTVCNCRECSLWRSGS